VSRRTGAGPWRTTGRIRSTVHVRLSAQPSRGAPRFITSGTMRTSEGLCSDRAGVGASERLLSPAGLQGAWPWLPFGLHHPNPSPGASRGHRAGNITSQRWVTGRTAGSEPMEPQSSGASWWDPVFRGLRVFWALSPPRDRDHVLAQKPRGHPPPDLAHSPLRVGAFAWGGAGAKNGRAPVRPRPS
jgi:hypothetical protein